MNTPAQHLYSPQFFEQICPVLALSIPEFEPVYFIHRVFDNRWPELEFRARAFHICRILHSMLPFDFIRSIEILTATARNLAHRNLTGIETIFLADYVEIYGDLYPGESQRALREIRACLKIEAGTMVASADANHIFDPH
jgi:hypothetical protein